MSKLVHKNGSISEAEAKGFCVHVCTREAHSEYSDTPYKVLAEHSCWRGTRVNCARPLRGLLQVSGGGSLLLVKPDVLKSRTGFIPDLPLPNSGPVTSP